jgi:hypothetical protein
MSIRTKRLFALALPCSMAGLMVSHSEPASAGWNPIRSAGQSFGSGLADSLATPTINKLERSGHNLVSDVNAKLEQRIDQFGGTLAGTVGKLDSLAEARLDQTDTILTARIAQLGVAANMAASTAIGGLDQVAKRRIAQLEQSGSRLIDQLGEERKKTLDHVDQVLHDRIGQLDQVVAQSLDDVDEILRERIDQLDDVAERRLGSADLMVTKQAVALENSLLRIGAVLAALVFLVYVFKELYRDFFKFWDEHRQGGDKGPKRIGLAALKAAGFVALRVSVAAICIGALFLYMKEPSTSRARLDGLIAENEKSFDKSRASLDFSRVRFYASQLSLLEPDETKRDYYRYEARKYELVRAVLSRPTLLQKPQGIRNVVGEIRALERATDPDPDLVALQAYVSFRVTQSSTTRHGEVEAAELAEKALLLAAQPNTAVVVLKPLAAAVLRALLEDPVPGSSVSTHFDKLRASLDSAGPAPFAPLESASVFDEAVAKLNEKSSNAFIAMLEAHAKSVLAAKALKGKQKRPVLSTTGEPTTTPALTEQEKAVAAALKARLDAARRVIQAWTEFDAELVANERLADSNVVFAVFGLNDAVLSQALWFEGDPNTAVPAPAIEAAPLRMRIHMTPVRVEWSRRYGQSLGRGTSWMFGFQEAERFKRYQTRVRAFVDAFVDLRTNPGDDGRTEERRRAAALAAAELGIYQGARGKRRALGLDLLGQGAAPDARSAVVEAYQSRQLRFL